MSAPLRLAALCLALCGCIEDLDPKDVVRGPRVLDILADRPEVRPGERSTLSVLLAGTQASPSYRWYVCIAPDATRPGMGLANFGEATFEGCFGDATPRQLVSRGATATFMAPATALDGIDALAMRFGARLPPGVLQAIARDVGLVVGVAVEVDVDGVTLKAYKRLVVSRNPRPNTNPPPPRFQFGRTWVSTSGREDGTCGPEDGSRLRARPGVEVEIAPEGNEERWFETYRVLTASGQIVDRTETAFYSFYTTGGRMSRVLSRSPTRNNAWVAPQAPGPVTLWSIVRDGHGGTSACRFEVTVE